MESDGLAVSAFWRVRTEGWTSSVQSVAGRDQTHVAGRNQTQLPSRFCGTTPLMCFPAVAPLWGGCRDTGGRGGGRGRTHLRGEEGGGLSEHFCALQAGQVHIEGLVEGTHLRRDAAHTHVEGDWKPLSNPKCDS